MFLAGFVLVLHNLTPHVHVDEHSDESPSNLTDWLEFAFSIDPGAGHLECFSQTESIDMDNIAELVVAFIPEEKAMASATELIPATNQIAVSPPGDPPDITPHSPRPPPLFV